LYLFKIKWIFLEDLPRLRVYLCIFLAAKHFFAKILKT